MHKAIRFMKTYELIKYNSIKDIVTSCTYHRQHPAAFMIINACYERYFKKFVVLVQFIHRFYHEMSINGDRAPLICVVLERNAL